MTRGRALIFDAENGYREFHRRVVARMGVPADAPLAYMDTVSNGDLDIVEHADYIASKIAEAQANLVVVDSLTSMSNGDQMTVEATRPYVRTLSTLARRLDVAILLLHHRPKAGGDYFGSVAIGSQSDVLLTFAKGVDRSARLNVSKYRIGAEPEPRTFQMGGADPQGAYIVCEVARDEQNIETVPAHETELAQAVLRLLAATPDGLGKVDLARAVKAHRTTLDAPLSALIEAGLVTRRDGYRGRFIAVP